MPTILCIDSDVRFLEAEKSVLEAHGYAVLVASDGPAGIRLACHNSVDAVVLAFKMPRMNGGQVAEVLLQDQPNLPIVICTGFFDAVPEALRWLADACVEKRDSPEALLSAIREVITHKKIQPVVV